MSIAPVRPRRSASERRAAANAACAFDSGTLGGGARARMMLRPSGATVLVGRWSAALTPVKSARFSIVQQCKQAACGADARAHTNSARVVRCHTGTSSRLAAAAAPRRSADSQLQCLAVLAEHDLVQVLPLPAEEARARHDREHRRRTGCAERTWCTSHPTPPARGKGGTPDVARRTSARATKQSKRSARVAPPQPAPFTRFACMRRLLAAGRSCAAP